MKFKESLSCIPQELLFHIQEITLTGNICMKCNDIVVPLVATPVLC